MSRFLASGQVVLVSPPPSTSTSSQRPRYRIARGLDNRTSSRNIVVNEQERRENGTSPGVTQHIMTDVQPSASSESFARHTAKSQTTSSIQRSSKKVTAADKPLAETILAKLEASALLEGEKKKLSAVDLAKLLATAEKKAVNRVLYALTDEGLIDRFEEGNKKSYGIRRAAS
ncbi:unnamed protein product [Amoebophrya sp. A25]|nr:unnamed protein product [Amoebophrya sp. A25]|eukprot:GSA25T00005809001.1